MSLADEAFSVCHLSGNSPVVKPSHNGGFTKIVQRLSKNYPMKDQNTVEQGVEYWAKWWISQRRKKLEEQLNETMSINPFMIPFIFDYHNLGHLDELVDLIIASHLMTGHATGFGKLIDEKILPHVFGTHKLSSSYRKRNSPFGDSCFDEIDHYIIREDGTKQLLSLKAGRWTIQLTMAVQLNAALNKILEQYPQVADEIVVGVFYGRKEDLTDKYDIIRGINRGANHDVVDIANHVHVYSGREFWSWLNCGEYHTQEWVLTGIIEALRREKIQETASSLLKSFKNGVVEKYEHDIRSGDSLDWHKFLQKING